MTMEMLFKWDIYKNIESQMSRWPIEHLYNNKRHKWEQCFRGNSNRGWIPRRNSNLLIALPVTPHFRLKLLLTLFQVWSSQNFNIKCLVIYGQTYISIASVFKVLSLSKTSLKNQRRGGGSPLVRFETTAHSFSSHGVPELVDIVTSL